MDSNLKWRLMSDQALHFRYWDDEYVVYDSHSGDTHLLGTVAVQVLFKLQQTPSIATELSASIAPLLHINMDDELVMQIDSILADLDKLALIERV